MSYDPESCTVIYRSRMHKSLKRNFQVMHGADWLVQLCAHIPDRFEHLVRYAGWYSNRSRGGTRSRATRRRSPMASRANPDLPPRSRYRLNSLSEGGARLIQAMHCLTGAKRIDCNVLFHQLRPSTRHKRHLCAAAAGRGAGAWAIRAAPCGRGRIDFP